MCRIKELVSLISLILTFPHGNGPRCSSSTRKMWACVFIDISFILVTATLMHIDCDSQWFHNKYYASFYIIMWCDHFTAASKLQTLTYINTLRSVYIPMETWYSCHLCGNTPLVLLILPWGPICSRAVEWLICWTVEKHPGAIPAGSLMESWPSWPQRCSQWNGRCHWRSKVTRQWDE